MRLGDQLKRMLQKVRQSAVNGFAAIKTKWAQLMVSFRTFFQKRMAGKGVTNRTLLVVGYVAVIMLLMTIVVSRSPGSPLGTFFADRDETQPTEDSTELDIDEIFDRAARRQEESREEEGSEGDDVPGPEELDEEEPMGDPLSDSSSETEADPNGPENYEETDPAPDKEEEQEDEVEEVEKVEEEEEDVIEVSEPQHIPTGQWPVSETVLVAHEAVFTMNNQHRFHQGVDIEASKGTRVYPAWPGEVAKVDENSRVGQMVIIAHEGYESLYGNLGRVSVSEGDWVHTEDKIATVGQSAKLCPPESDFLHFEVLLGDKAINPEEVLP